MKLLVQLSRILVGVLFIISGLIKANDPTGFGYKLEEYYQVFGTEFLISTAAWQAMLICIAEILLGFMLLIGNRVKLTVWLLLAMIVFFTFLTFYSAYFNKVTDCGCFGDAVKLTPWESFSKDVVLLVLILILTFGMKHIRPLTGPKLSNALLLTVLFAATAFPLYTYNYLPVKDFRPYAVGKDILEGMKGGVDPVFETHFIYRDTIAGKDSLFAKIPYTDTINWTTGKWKFVDQQSKEVKAGIPAPIHDFSLTDPDGNDYTEDLLQYEGYQFFLVSYDLTKANRGVQPQINDLAALCEKNKVPFIGLTAATPEMLDEFRHEVQAAYPWYIVDATQLKTMIRSNPGLILLKGSKVMAMWPYRSLPSFDAVKQQWIK
ncbi:MAG: DoxX family membrane protein [Bacteroidia bacterium]|nr:DoxX family membrane protein [Bacteroidia bacterium]MCC6769114.1 DoxX family membrane protein [Bacteroidia bacterium]